MTTTDRQSGLTTPAPEPDPQEPPSRLLRDLRTRSTGLSDREAARRLEAGGANELERRRHGGLGTALLRQLVHPLALLLWLAAGLAAATGALALAVAIVLVILLNAAFAIVQERHAERAVEALADYLPPHARVIRDGTARDIPARELVPGDLIVVAEGDHVSADARILSGTVWMDLSMLNGESAPACRNAETSTHTTLLEATDLLFSGTSCTRGRATAVVFGTGMHTEIGRIAALSQRVRQEASPLETQVKRVAKVIAVVAVALGVAFVPIGMLFAGLSLSDALNFAIGLLVANVPEGLLPTITLALAVGVRVLARQGALVKQVSAVETLGSTSVICTDKTGTLTLNRMSVERCWTPTGATKPGPASSPEVIELLRAGAACSNATWTPLAESGDPTEVALLREAAAYGAGPRIERLRLYDFDPALRRMSTIDRDRTLPDRVQVHTKGAPEAVLALCSRVADPAAPEGATDLDDVRLGTLNALIEEWAREGLRLLAIAVRTLTPAEAHDLDRDEIERDLTLLGLVALLDPPRPEVAHAVASCQRAGIRIIVVTGDHGLTAQGIAARVGIGGQDTPVVNGTEMDAMSEDALDALLAGHRELIFARSSPEAKLRITDALRSQGHVVAMTGDGVNDAPALRRADIGVAMGRGGTDVAREAAKMVLTDDDFATIVTAVESGRQVYDNVRKFIVYIFAHATPEVVPFLLYALSGGSIPLPLTVMQILAIDLGTETLPALALGREPAEPGIMNRPPRPRSQSVVDRTMLARAWLLLGGVSAVLVTALFLITLLTQGWHLGADVSSEPLRTTWHEATTMTFLGIVACQIGTAVAARTQHASLLRIGVFSNPLLLWGIAFEVAFSALLVAVPELRKVFGMAVPDAWLLLLLLPLPVLTWGVDELWRWARRRSEPSSARG